MHPFERANLGSPPFKFIGAERKVYVACPGAPAQPGSSCDYCGQGISYEFWVRGHDGRTFKVGCDCIMKLCREDNALVMLAERAQAKLAKETKAETLAARIAQCSAALDSDPALLTDRPHGNEYLAKTRSLTLRDQVQWLLARGGAAGKTRACRIVEAANKA